MAAPRYVPNTIAEQPRRGLEIPAPDRWVAERPAELEAEQPTGRQMGKPGPDQGYGLKLARRFEDRLQLQPGEHREDAVAGCLGVALARASAFGRAPVIHDCEVAYRIWGFLGDAPEELLRHRKPLFEQVGHHYNDQRAIVDATPLSTLVLPKDDVAARFPSEWRALLGLD